MNWLLDLAGIPDLTDGHVTAWRVMFARPYAPVLFGLGLVVAIVSAVYSYRREPADLRRLRRVFLGIVRSILILAIVLILLEPTLAVQRAGTLKSNIVVLVDTSLSMTIEDRRQSEPDRRRAARALGLLPYKGGGAQSLTKEQAKKTESPSRLSLVKGLLLNEDLGLVRELTRNCHVRLYGFGVEAKPLTIWRASAADEGEQQFRKALGDLRPDATATAVGPAIRAALDQLRGQPIAGMLLFSDGIHNRGENPLISAETAAALRIPIYTVSVGVPGTRDIAVTDILAEDVVFVKDKVVFPVSLVTRGLQGESVQLVLREGERIIEEKDIVIGSDEQDVEFEFLPEQEGEFTYTIEAPPLEDEPLTDNNSRSKTVRVISAKIRALYIEGEPRWEYRFIKNGMIRDQRIDPRFLLVEGDKQVAAEGSVFINKLPADPTELAEYDLIIFGDVDPKFFSPGQLEQIEEFVSKAGGGLLAIAGERFTPWAYRGTPLQHVFPVELGLRRKEGWETEIYEPRTQPFRMELTEEGRFHPVTRLAFDMSENARAWRRLPPMYWFAKVTRAKPAATVLANHSAARSQYGPQPLLVAHSYGKGVCLFSAVDEVWRWRLGRGDQYAYRFWSQAIQYLAIPHLLGQRRRIQITTEAEEYTIGVPVRVNTRLLDKAYQPSRAAEIRAVVRKDEQDVKTISLAAVEGKAGMFRGEFLPESDGIYAVGVTDEEDPSESATVSFTIRMPKIEFTRPETDTELMAQIAEATQGKAYRLDELASLPCDVAGKTRSVVTNDEKELWDTWFAVLVIVLLATVEWGLRKLWNLS